MLGDIGVACMTPLRNQEGALETVLGVSWILPCVPLPLADFNPCSSAMINITVSVMASLSSASPSSKLWKLKVILGLSKPAVGIRSDGGIGDS